MPYDNKEQEREYNKTYYESNKQEINKRIKKWSKEIRCICCGKEITNKNYPKHLKSKEHRKWLSIKFKSIHNELLERFK